MNGHEMHRWTDSDGVDWQCDAYDHGPFCRSCRVVLMEGGCGLDPLTVTPATLVWLRERLAAPSDPEQAERLRAFLASSDELP